MAGQEQLAQRPAVQAAGLTRREFIPRAVAALMGAGALLSPRWLSAGAARDRAGAEGMKYRMLGKTGIKVSTIGFGSHLDDALLANPLARASHIRRGLELGINLFDVYDHNFHQFAPMGQILGPVRQEVVISLVAVWNQRQVRQEVEYALKTFGTDYIDLYRIYADTGTSTAEAETSLRALQQAKQEGKIRAVGLVAHDHIQLVQMLRTFPDLDYLMLPYNFRHQKVAPVAEVQPRGQAKAEEARSAPAPEKPQHLDGISRASSVDCLSSPCSDPELLPLVRQTGVGLIAIKPFAAGGLLQLGRSDPLVAQLLTQTGLSLPQAALRFVLDTPEIASVIPAMNSLDEVAENVGAVQGEGLSRAEAELLQLWSEAAERAQGAYLPAKYAWLEQWTA